MLPDHLLEPDAEAAGSSKVQLLDFFTDKLLGLIAEADHNFTQDLVGLRDPDSALGRATGGSWKDTFQIIG